MIKSKARQELDKDRDFIFWLFGYKCLMCGKPTNIIHEIQPISHGMSSLHWTNRIPLCLNHHLWSHESTKVSIPILQQKRLQFLKRKNDIDLEAKKLEFLDSVSTLTRNQDDFNKQFLNEWVVDLDEQDLPKEPKDKEDLSG